MDIVQNDTTICQGDSIELSVLTNPSTFINWRNGFPNNNSSERYASIQKDSSLTEHGKTNLQLHGLNT